MYTCPTACDENAHWEGTYVHDYRTSELIGTIFRMVEYSLSAQGLRNFIRYMCGCWFLNESSLVVCHSECCARRVF